MFSKKTYSATCSVTVPNVICIVITKQIPLLKGKQLIIRLYESYFLLEQLFRTLIIEIPEKQRL